MSITTTPVLQPPNGLELRRRIEPENRFAAATGVCSIELLCCDTKHTKDAPVSEHPGSYTNCTYEVTMGFRFESLGQRANLD